jgi:hypothetical protein
VFSEHLPLEPSFAESGPTECVFCRLQKKREKTKMSTSITRIARWTMAVAIALFVLFLGTVRNAQAAELAGCQNRPVVKNLMALTARPTCARAAALQQFTRKEIKNLTATAKSPEDHLGLALFYKGKASRLDAEGAQYEEAAAVARNTPTIKNLMAPTTAARYAYSAKGFREEAESDRKFAAAHEEMAKNAVASL